MENLRVKGIYFFSLTHGLSIIVSSPSILNLGTHARTPLHSPNQNED
jgi:hypothetical protein